MHRYTRSVRPVPKHRATTHQGKSFPVVRFGVVLIFSLCGHVFGQPVERKTSELLELLDKAAATNVAPKTYAADLETRVEYLQNVLDDDPIGTEIYVTKIYVDEGRLDVSQLGTDVRNGKTSPVFRSRSIWDGSRFLSRNQPLGKGIRQLQVLTSKNLLFRDALLSQYGTAPFLRGYCLGDPVGMVQLIKDATQAVHVEDDQMIDGHPCSVLSATTPYGHYRLWVDTAGGFQVRRAIVTKKEGDFDGNRRLPIVEGEWKQIGAEYRIDITQFELVDNRYIPTGGSVEASIYFDQEKVQRTRHTARVTSFRLHPDFAAEKAFVMDGIPDGTPVRDADSQDGLRYIWQDGTITLDSDLDTIREIDRAIAKEKIGTDSPPDK